MKVYKIKVNGKTYKVMINGQLLLVNGNQIFTVTGQRVK